MNPVNSVDPIDNEKIFKKCRDVQIFIEKHFYCTMDLQRIDPDYFASSNPDVIKARENPPEPMGYPEIYPNQFEVGMKITIYINKDCNDLEKYNEKFKVTPSPNSATNKSYKVVSALSQVVVQTRLNVNYRNTDEGFYDTDGNIVVERSNITERVEYPAGHKESRLVINILHRDLHGENLAALYELMIEFASRKINR